MKVKVFTGYVPAFDAVHLSEAQFRVLGARLRAALPINQIEVFDEDWRIDSCWAYKFLAANPALMPSDAAPAPDRFAKPQDMTRSNIAILQRFAWLELAARLWPDVDAWIWLEYTIFKQPGITQQVVEDFVRAVESHPFNAISIPGCWDKGPVNDSSIHWRFCGSAWVCPRQYAAPLFDAVKTVVTLRTEATKTISWDVNTLAYVELLDCLPIRWYRGNHDQTQLTNYLGA